MIVDLIEAFYRLLWGDLFTLPVAGGIGISFMVVLLFAAGIGFTLRTRLLPVRLFRDMIGAVCEKKQAAGGLSSFQTLVISTATRVGMGNLVGVVAAVSAGGAGAVFWMWVTALLGASTSFVESTLAQKYRVPDPLYGGWRGGPAYYLHVLAERKRGKKLRRSVCAALFAVSGLICWCGISQVISNSVSSAFENAFHVPPLATTVVLTLLAALIVLRKNATVKSLDFIVPVMAVCYFVITVGIVVLNLRQLPAVLARIFAEAFGLRQVAAGGFGAVLMNGVKRGLFSNEAGSGSAPCAAAAAECDDPVKMGLVQALGVLIDTVVICSCTAFLMLLVPQEITAGLTGMNLLQTAMQYHLGSFGIVFIAVILALFSFSTFLGVLYYARGNVAYLCGCLLYTSVTSMLLAGKKANQLGHPVVLDPVGADASRLRTDTCLLYTSSHRTLAGAGDLEALTRVLGEAVQVQAVFPVGAADERQTVGTQMGAGKVEAAAQMLHQGCLLYTSPKRWKS